MRFSHHDIFWSTLLAVLIIIPLALAGPADPGHTASAIGPGTFEAGAYIFPATSTVTIEPPGQLCLGGECKGEWPVGGLFYNITPDSYTGSLSHAGLTGYQAANAICNASFPGTHMCTQVEIINTIHEKNISAIAEWTGSAWVNAGGAKYVPADYPVNDCRGWTDDTSNSMGNFWIFDQTTGGRGAARACNVEIKIACCK